MSLQINPSVTSFEDPRCARCPNTSNLKNCARCGYIQYCSEACQRLAWATHKAVCGKPVTFTLPGGSRHTAENSEFDGLPVIKKAFDPETDSHSEPIWKLAERDPSIPRETVEAMKKAMERTYFANYSIVYRPYYIKQGEKFLCNSQTHEKVIHLQSAVVNERTVDLPDGTKGCLVPVFTKPFVGTS